MIVIPGKFQAMVMRRFVKMKNKHKMYIQNKKITPEHSVKLLVVAIDNQLNFDNHISTLCKKAGSQLNATGRLWFSLVWISIGLDPLVFQKKGFDRSLCIFTF